MAKNATDIKKLKGPILILGAGGFVGFNLLQHILRVRNDVYGVFREYDTNWRIMNAKIPSSNRLQYDITKKKDIDILIKKINPQTIFNLAAYGAYARQSNIKKIYETNFSSTIYLLEKCKRNGFSAYIHTGSQSEYGLNAKAPAENDDLIPNSHYAVSKVADYYLLKYYGKVEKLPVIHLRLYSVYGPWEEPDRLIPAIILQARRGKFPPLVDKDISRDFVYIDDVVNALILAALKINKKIYGEAFNVATGKKTTIEYLTRLIKKTFSIKVKPIFNEMPKRQWDLTDWYGNNKKIKAILSWKMQTTVEKGLLLTAKWQEDINYDKISEKWKFKK